MTHASVEIQIAPQSAPTLPCWFAEVARVVQFFTTSGLLQAIEQRVRFARPRFGTYETLDFIVVLLGYAVSAESTLQAFYERLTPFASTFMALFNRQALPHRSTLSRFLGFPGSAHGRNLASPVSRGSRRADRPDLSPGWTVGSSGKALACHGC